MSVGFVRRSRMSHICLCPTADFAGASRITFPHLSVSLTMSVPPNVAVRAYRRASLLAYRDWEPWRCSRRITTRGGLKKAPGSSRSGRVLIGKIGRILEPARRQPVRNACCEPDVRTRVAASRVANFGFSSGVLALSANRWLPGSSPGQAFAGICASGPAGWSLPCLKTASGTPGRQGCAVELILADYTLYAPVFLRKLDGAILYWTRGAEELYGFTPAEAQGRVSHELLRTVFPTALSEIDAILVSRHEWEGRLRHTKRDGREIWTESLWRLKEGDVVLERNTDVTARMQLERERDRLLVELEHRIRNTLAVVQSVASMTFRATVPELTDQFDERIQALADAVRVLARGDWDRAPLRDVILEIARGLGFQDRIALDGPDVELRPSAVHAYTLAFHELATNAIRHGALSRPQGRVEVTWSVWSELEERIHLVWREHGGPVVMPPQQQGFGSRLLQIIVASELGTPVEMRYEPGGFVCEFDGPLQKKPRMG